MKLYDVAWSTSENKWVMREPRLRWVGDTFAIRDACEKVAHRVVTTANERRYSRDVDPDLLRRIWDSSYHGVWS